MWRHLRENIQDPTRGGDVARDEHRESHSRVYVPSTHVANGEGENGDAEAEAERIVDRFDHLHRVSVTVSVRFRARVRIRGGTRVYGK